MYSIICVFLIHIIIFTLQHALFSHLLIHANLVYSFHVPNSIPLNDNSAVYLPTLQATDSRDISLLLAMLQLTLSYLALRTRTWFHSAFISIPSPGPTKGKSETLSPWSLLAGFLWSPATWPLRQREATSAFRCSFAPPKEMWGAVSFSSPEPKLTRTSLHWDLYTFRFPEGHLVAWSPSRKRLEVSYYSETGQSQRLTF